MAKIDVSILDLNTTVVVATGNANKLAEIEDILGKVMSDYKFVALGDLGNFEDPEENGDTFYDNAFIKAEAALDATGLKMAIAEDSGLCVDALGGAPGIYSARWAGRYGDYNFNNEQLLERMEYIPDPKRTAHFHSTVVFLDRRAGMEKVLVGEGNCYGRIAHDMRGENGFGYDPIFELVDNSGKRMAELTMDEKDVISHRRRALDGLVENFSWYQSC